MRSMYYRVPDKYQKNSRGNPRGIVILANEDRNNNTVGLGWSLCHKTDEFNKATARKFALARLESEPSVVDYSNLDSIVNSVNQLPNSMQDTAKRMLYYKYMNYQRDLYFQAFRLCQSPVSSTK